MSVVTLFKNTQGNCAVALRVHGVVPFVQGRFFTINQKLQDELQEAADNGEYCIYVDTQEPTIDTEAATPLDQLKAKLREELRAEMRQQELIDAGNSSVTGAQLQRAVTSTADLVTSGAAELTAEEQALRDGSQVTEPATPLEDAEVKPVVAASPALSALERLKQQGS